MKVEEAHGVPLFRRRAPGKVHLYLDPLGLHVPQGELLLPIADIHHKRAVPHRRDLALVNAKHLDRANLGLHFLEELAPELLGRSEVLQHAEQVVLEREVARGRGLTLDEG